MFPYGVMKMGQGEVSSGKWQVLPQPLIPDPYFRGGIAL
jgi:hypothetical protein